VEELQTEGGDLNFLRSRLGWLLVALYVAVVVATYQDALAKRGTWLYDIGLDLVVLPYIVIVGRFLLGDATFGVHADAPWGLLPAVLFCSALLLIGGAFVEKGARHALGKIRARRAGPEA
jgi:hypothetical protein